MNKGYTFARVVPGEKHRKLTAINSLGRGHWLWLCDCGGKHEARSCHVRSGKINSCGCSDLRGKHDHTTHGMSRTPTYASWRAMFDRCRNSNHVKFALYGGAGVKICERWHAFKNFLADMGPRPKGKSLDRYPNPAGNYEPGNCRWATPKQQRENRR